MIGEHTVRMFGKRISIGFDEDNGEHRIGWEEANCYGFGHTEAGAIEDLKSAAESMYWMLIDEPDEKLSPRERGWKKAIAVLDLKETNNGTY